MFSNFPVVFKHTMYKVIVGAFFFGLLLVDTSAEDRDIKLLRCLVCKNTVNEWTDKVKKIDPDRKVEIGGYRIDSTGNSKQKVVSEAKSEVHLSEIGDTICDVMEEYVRARWKDSGKLTLLKLVVDGHMNSDSSLVDFVQDDDLNKSLKYYCEGILDEYEDSIIEHFKNGFENIAEKVCAQEARLCIENRFEETERVQDEL